MRSTLLSSYLILTLTFLFPSAIFAQAPITADSYLYLSQIERVFNGDMEEEYVWTFLSGDTCDGIVRSNDFIFIHKQPVFLDHVYTFQENFMEHGANPIFSYEPIFNVSTFEFAYNMEEMAEIAEEAGSYFDNNNGTWNTQLVAHQYGWSIIQWPLGLPLLPETIHIRNDLFYEEELVLFIDGPLYIEGESVRGHTTVVANGDVYITDNLVYDGTNIGEEITIPEDTTTVLGIIAAGDILIANTTENGSRNGLFQGELSDHSNKHCVVTASLVSLNGSFTFENKNFDMDSERFDGYCYCDSEGDHAGETDRRGTVYLLGSLAFHRRNYMSTSNCGGTGYTKHYRYDSRLHELTPPLFDTALSVDWGQNGQASIPVNHEPEDPYPNPFNSSFNLNMVLAKRDQVQVRLINVLGQEVLSQNFGWMDMGQQRFTIHMNDHPTGLYFAQVSTSSGFIDTKKVLFIK